jgi:hypothetical protein
MTIQTEHAIGIVTKQGKLLFAAAIGDIGTENLICAHVSEVVFANNPPAVPVLHFVPSNPLLVSLVGMILSQKLSGMEEA